jgi:hypothetical protein
MEEQLPIIEKLSEDNKVKIQYLGGDYLYLSDETNTIQIHLGNIEWMQETINNL